MSSQAWLSVTAARRRREGAGGVCAMEDRLSIMFMGFLECCVKWTKCFADADMEREEQRRNERWGVRRGGVPIWVDDHRSKRLPWPRVHALQGQTAGPDCKVGFRRRGEDGSRHRLAVGDLCLVPACPASNPSPRESLGTASSCRRKGITPMRRWQGQVTGTMRHGGLWLIRADTTHIEEADRQTNRSEESTVNGEGTALWHGLACGLGRS